MFRTSNIGLFSVASTIEYPNVTSFRKRLKCEHISSIQTTSAFITIPPYYNYTKRIISSIDDQSSVSLFNVTLFPHNHYGGACKKNS